MLKFLHQLRQRYAQQPESPQREQRLDSLSLAIAAFCRLAQLAARGVQGSESGTTPTPGGPAPDGPGELSVDLTRPPPQIVIIGPTQSGKSSLVNLLAGDQLAGVSALAGYTRHPQGFGFGLDEQALVGLDHCLRPYRRVAPEELTPDRLDRFSLIALPDSTPLGRPGVLWDTPDFDSVAAHHYRQSVLTVAAQADRVIMIASRDKYGDLSVWRTLEMLAPLGLNLSLVINKVSPGTEAELRRHIGEELEQRLPSHGRVPIFMLPYSAALSQDDAPEPELKAAIEQLRADLGGAFEPGPADEDLAARRARIVDLLDVHWRDWIEPLRAEHAAQAQWRDLVDRQLAELLDHYRQDFLADSDRYDTFQRILAELLTLLEIPGIAQTMGRVRRWVTWPVRQLLDRGEQLIHGNSKGDPNNEQKVLRQACEHLLLELTRSASDRSSGELSVFWRALELRLAHHRLELLGAFEQAALRHHEDFQVEIQMAAHRLHERLAEQPRVLNSLRTGRAAADIAGVAIALKTGGIGLSDLILTPAMLSMTSILTEGALGKYVDQVVADLKERQLEHVRMALIDRVLRPELTELPRDLASDQLFSLSAERLQEAEQARRRLRHG